MPERLTPLPANETTRIAGLVETLSAELSRRDGGGPLTATLDDLPRLQSMVDRTLLGDATRRDQMAAAFGQLLASQLGLSWLLCCDDGADAGAGEPVLRYRDTDVVFYPWRLLQRQLASDPELQLARLFKNTKDYLVNLQRFLFSDRKTRQGEGHASGRGH